MFDRAIQIAKEKDQNVRPRNSDFVNYIDNYHPLPGAQPFPTPKGEG